MPRIVDYATVSQRMLAAGFVSLYHNSGAFGFARGAEVKMLGWIGPDDGTIRAEVRPFTRPVPPPHASNLAGMLVNARRHLPGDTWLMPKSHWHFELHDGHPDLLSTVLPEIGIDPALLRERNDGSAIAFAADENEPLRRALERLLGNMRQSDFLLAFPDAADARTRAVCTVHHHSQLWWQTDSLALFKLLEDQSTQSST
jgi:hypothetical protein